MGALSLEADRSVAYNTCMNAIEIFGTAASVIVAISLTMKNIKRLRILNLAGAAGFAAYGFLIHSMPVTVLNAFIAAIDLYYLWRMRATRDMFQVLGVAPTQSSYVQLFLQFYADDIARFQPDFTLDPSGLQQVEFVLRDMMPVSIVVYKQRAEREYEIELDYAVPSYRDYRNAQFYFSEELSRIAKGEVVDFVAYSRVPAHSRYLEKVGFKATGK